jgi:hypothetical protein
MHMPANETQPVGVRVRVSSEAATDELAQWDEFVRRVASSDVAQLSGWRAVRAEAGFGALHVFAHRSESLVGGAQVFVRRIPLVGSIGYVSSGPVVADGLEDRAEVVGALVTAMTELLRNGIRVLFVQPPAGADDVSRALTGRGFRFSQAGIAPAASVRLDLSADEEQLLAGLETRLRRWTRRWHDRGVAVRLGDSSDLPLLADLMAKSAAYQGYEPLSLDYLELLYGSLAPTGNAVLFVGEADGSPVAVDLFTYCSDVMKARLTGMDRDSPATALNVPAALQWNAILWAKAQGARWFDFGGLNEGNAATLIAGGSLDPATAGRDYFKLRFGGEPYLMPPAVEAARPQLALRCYDLAQRSERGRAAIGTLRRRMRGRPSPTPELAERPAKAS